ncbi:hypothetical protein Baya_13956 [Bagarius yarrelli]|uniref:Uncharacterized protein n=1 Tax=Bagarius yarrelli TaxID=175774 RepID=A0A556V7D7_BAGYA|nr:hypothetical protein Baya_13956 [Bagarius yarrelli]
MTRKFFLADERMSRRFPAVVIRASRICNEFGSLGPKRRHHQPSENRLIGRHTTRRFISSSQQHHKSNQLKGRRVFQKGSFGALKIGQILKDIISFILFHSSVMSPHIKYLSALYVGMIHNPNSPE